MDSRMAALELVRSKRARSRRVSTLGALVAYLRSKARRTERFSCLGGCNRELPVEQAAVRQPGEGLTICDDCFGEYTVAEVAAAVRLAS